MASKYALFLFIAAQVCATLALPPCVCTRNRRPVCGSDGKTYSNQCLLDCARLTTNSELTKVKEGSCTETETPNCICTFEYNPVCGTDGTTYPNRCTFNCQRSLAKGLELSHQGACEKVNVANIPPCTCPTETKPVCGSDGTTYGNDCLLNCATAQNHLLSIAHRGPCAQEVKETEQPACSCTRDVKPVCGSDGTTYGNDCLLNCATAQNNLLSIKHWGACEEVKAEAGNCACTRNFRPVCGKDGVTYNNVCLLNCAGTQMARDAPCDE